MGERREFLRELHGEMDSVGEIALKLDGYTIMDLVKFEDQGNAIKQNESGNSTAVPDWDLVGGMKEAKQV